MKVALDALTAEIARNVDWNIREWDSQFEEIPRAHRMNLILHHLASLDVARAEKSDGAVGIRWKPSRRLEAYFGVTRHGIADDYEDVEQLMPISGLADELSRILQGNEEAVEIHIVHTVVYFALYRLGMLEYRGRKDGVCEFNKSSNFAERCDEYEQNGDLASVTEVLDEAGRTVELIQNFQATGNTLMPLVKYEVMSRSKLIEKSGRYPTERR